MHQILSYALIVIWLLSAVVLTVSVLLHSGKGGGIADDFAAFLGSPTTSSSVVEHNLDRITHVSIVVFFIGLLLMMNFDLFPIGTVG